jgi:hypothetical protein
MVEYCQAVLVQTGELVLLALDEALNCEVFMKIFTLKTEICLISWYNPLQ